MRDLSRSSDGEENRESNGGKGEDNPFLQRREVLAGAGGLGLLVFGGGTASYVSCSGSTSGRVAATGDSAPATWVEDPAFERHAEEHNLPEPPTLDDIDTQRTRDAVEDLGLDSSGSDPIQGTLTNAIENGDRIEFPSGTYRLSSSLRIDGHSNFALVGTGDVSFVVDSGLTQNVLSYRNCRDCAFVGIDIDQSADNCSAQTGFNTEGVLIVRDVEFVGYSDPDDSGKKIAFNVRDSNGVAKFENVIATDGTEVGRSGVDHNDVHKQQYDGAYWSGPPHEGTAYFIDCAAANWSDNGIYASRTNGGIVVLGGYYANSSISQIRLGHPESFVGGGCHMVVDRDEIPEENNPSGLAFTRGVWLESGHLDNDGATVGRCNIRVGDVGRFGGCIRVSSTGANARIEGTVEVIAPDDITRLNASPSISVRDGAIQDVDEFSIVQGDDGDGSEPEDDGSDTGDNGTATGGNSTDDDDEETTDSPVVDEVRHTDSEENEDENPTEDNDGGFACWLW